VPALVTDLCGRHALKKTGGKDELAERLCAKGLLQGGEGGGGGGRGRRGGGDAAVISLIQDSDLYTAKYKVRELRHTCVCTPACLSITESRFRLPTSV
jgi:hypothetical protein